MRPEQNIPPSGIPVPSEPISSTRLLKKWYQNGSLVNGTNDSNPRLAPALDILSGVTGPTVPPLSACGFLPPGLFQGVERRLGRGLQELRDPRGLRHLREPRSFWLRAPPLAKASGLDGRRKEGSGRFLCFFWDPCGFRSTKAETKGAPF